MMAVDDSAAHLARCREELCGTLHTAYAREGIIITLGLVRDSDPLHLSGVWQSSPEREFVFYTEEVPYLGLRIA